jgi:hypothetical protein
MSGSGWWIWGKEESSSSSSSSSASDVVGNARPSFKSSAVGFVGAATDPLRYAVWQIEEELAALKAQVRALIDVVERLCRFLGDDRAMLPALRDNTEHFAAHYIKQDGARGCQHCAAVTELTSAAGMALVALWSRFFAASTRVQHAARNELAQKPSAHSSEAARRLYNKYSSLRQFAAVRERSALISAAIARMRALLLGGPTPDKGVDAAFDEICDCLRDMIAHIDALFEAPSEAL